MVNPYRAATSAGCSVSGCRTGGSRLGFGTGKARIRPRAESHRQV